MVLQAITLADVLAWLQGFPSDEVVGRTHAPRDCPLARYVRVTVVHPALQDTVRVVVGPEGLSLDSAFFPISEWVRQFVNQFDDLAPVGQFVPVTAAQALVVLQQVLLRQGVPASVLVLVDPS